MRITNRMMTNNMLSNINGNKTRLDTLEEQYSTGLKINKPSEDPIVAVRALKLRTNLSELNQYYEKNIPDAKAWMDVTEGALNNVSDIYTKLNTYCVQGANDTLTKDDRSSIAANLAQLKDQIYQEGDSNYAGRYVFTGFKTDTSLVFDDITDDYSYTITEKMTASDVDVIDKAVNDIAVDLYDESNPSSSDLSNKPNTITTYRLRLSYDELIDEEDGGSVAINLNPIVDDEGNYVYDDDGNLTYEDTFDDVTIVSSSDADAYQPAEGTAHLIAETGELILAEDVYRAWTNTENETQIHVTYNKDSFQKNELRPEHYFDCTRVELDDDGNAVENSEVVFKKQDQQIEYEVNFNQKLTVNTQGSDSITHAAGRFIDEILAAIDDVNIVEDRITEIENMLKASDVTDDQKTTLNEMLELLDTEKVIKEEIMQSTFERAITETQEQQNVVGVALADLGSRYVRIELTESRLSLQQDDFTDLLSKNEDADLVDTVINFISQETIYNASLSAASKVVQNSLLDFL